MSGKPKVEFKKPGSEKVSIGDQRSIPNVSCNSVDSARAQLRDAGFEPSVSGNPVESDCPAGTVAGTSPDGRTIKGGFVAIQISKGRAASPPNRGRGNQQPGNSPPIIIFPGNGGGQPRR
jgi:beta-lactam-binding protein with PASTA domain